MPLAAIKTQNNNGRSAGDPVLAAHFDNVTDPSNNFKYVNVGGRIWASTESVPTGSNAVVIQHAQVDSKFAQIAFAFMVTVNPSTGLEICQIRTGTIGTSTKRASILLDTSSSNPRCTLRDGADAVVFQAIIARDVPYIFRGRFDSGTTTTNGRLGGTLIRESDLVSMGSGEKTDANTGSGANVALHQTGKVSSTGTVGLLLDDFAFWDSAYTLIDPAASPPELVLTDNGPYWMFDARGTTGGATSYTIEHLSGPNSSSGIVEPVDGLFFIPQNTLSSTYTVTATSGGGSDPGIITVPPKAMPGQAPGTVRRRVWDGTELI